MRLGLGRLRRERRRRAGARGDRPRASRGCSATASPTSRRSASACRAAARSTSSSSGSSDARRPAARARARRGAGRALHRARGRARGAQVLVLLDRGEVVGDDSLGLAALAPDVRRNGKLEHEGARVFAEVFGPPPRLVVVGAVDTGEALCAAAKALGWHTICVDARAKFATPRAHAERRRAGRRMARRGVRAHRARPRHRRRRADARREVRHPGTRGRAAHRRVLRRRARQPRRRRRSAASGSSRKG